MELLKFHRMHIIDNAPHLSKGHVDFKSGAKQPDSPSTSEKGIPIVYLNLPPDDERHAALGRYMDAWSRLEQSLAFSLVHATGVQLKQIHVLMNALGLRGVHDVISSLAPAKLSNAQTAELTEILEAVKTNNTKRNHIVHGRWALEIRLYDWNGQLGAKALSYRCYDPADTAIRDAMVLGEDKDARKKYMFSVARIKSVTRALHDLGDRLKKFNRAAGVLPTDALAFATLGLAARPS